MNQFWFDEYRLQSAAFFCALAASRLSCRTKANTLLALLNESSVFNEQCVHRSFHFATLFQEFK